MEPGLEMEAPAGDDIDPAEVQQVVMEVLRQLSTKRRGARAESVMAPPPPEPAAGGAPEDDAQMAELEAMLADPDAVPPMPKKPGEDDEDELE
jgi:hypothetical protein